MKLQQLTYVCAIVDRGLNVTHAARHLHTSQPGISRYVKMLESELGVDIFIRNKKKIAGLTPVGYSVYAAAKRALSETENVKRVVSEFLSGDVGDLTVATSHTHARYSLPPVIERFIGRFPRVRLRLRQGNVNQISNWVIAGEADISIATPSSESLPGLVFLPCHELHRIILTRPGHPLLKAGKLTLEDVAAHPIITYDYEFSARSQIMRAFHRKRLTPNYMLHFIELYAPHLSRSAVQQAVYGHKSEAKVRR